MKNLVLHGLYTMNDTYFTQYGHGYWVDNKNENRPYYYALKDPDGIDWLIPMSSQVANYSAKIHKIEAARGAGNCIYYHIAKIASIDRVFLIGDMFPVSPSHVKAQFTINKVHYVVQDSKLNRMLYSKAMRYLQLVSNGKIHSRNDILGIKKSILQNTVI